MTELVDLESIFVEMLGEEEMSRALKVFRAYYAKRFGIDTMNVILLAHKAGKISEVLGALEEHEEECLSLLPPDITLSNVWGTEVITREIQRISEVLLST